MQSACRQVKEEVVAVDGKELCGSYDRHSNNTALHITGAWASENRLSLRQVKTEEKSNEITAIPRLPEALDVSGCVVTIDAMGRETDTAETIVQDGADYRCVRNFVNGIS